MNHESKRPFNWRGFVSVTTGLACLGMAITGIVLFFIPAGRIANWNDWQFWGLSKRQWNGLHIWFCILFMITSIVHVYYNWTCLINYFKDKTRQHLALRWEWTAALLLIWILSAGTVRGMIPFSSLMNWHVAIKYRHNSQPTIQESSIPEKQGQGFGKMTLSTYCEQMDLDLNWAQSTLEQSGILVNEDMTLWDIANHSQSHPSEIRRRLETPQ